MAGESPDGLLRVAVADIRIDPDAHVPGLDLPHLLRIIACPDPRPIEVSDLADGSWLLVNGRHRWVRALIVGQLFLPAVRSEEVSGGGP